MTYHNAVKRILTAPMGSDARSADRLSLLCRFLAFPLKGITFIKILGQSGKSSCANLLSRTLVSAGYRVGMLATPFAHNITECVVINGQTVSMDQFTQSVEATLSAAASIREAMTSLADGTDEENSDSLSAFEKSLLAYNSAARDFSLFSDELLLISALTVFFEQKCQIVILEVPSDERAGAYRLPVAPAVSVITSTEDTKTAISVCRALDRNTPEIVTALQSKQIYNMIAGACAEINCRLSMPLRSAYYPVDLTANRMRFFYKNVEHSLNSGAHYQALNLLTVSETLEALKRHGFSAKNDCIDLTLDVSTTIPKTYFSFLSIRPTIVMDCADSSTRVAALAHSLRPHAELLGNRITIIAEKDALSDQFLTEKFAEEAFLVQEIVRIDLSGARRDLKPRVQSLAPDDTWIVLGSRPFTYEVARTLQSLLAL